MLAKVGQQLVRGFFMGMADIVPGVSGGTVALVFGIYERLLDAVRTGASALGLLVKGDVRGFVERLMAVDWLFLIPLLVGVLGAIAALSSLIDRLLQDRPEEMAGLFFGLVVASILVAWRLLEKRDVLRLGLLVAMGILTFILLGFQSGPALDPPLLAFLGAGAIAICAMILPGVSGSFLLLMMGMYSALLTAVHNRDITTLLVFMVGATIGLALFSTVLGWLLDNYRDSVLAVLIGLMLGSLRVLWPWPNGVGVVSEIEHSGDEHSGESAGDVEVELEVISGTGIEWPSMSDFWLPTLLAVVAFVVVVGVSQIAERREHAA